MSHSNAIGLINNAALLLALCLLYDMLGFRIQERKTIIQQILTGIVLGAIGLAIMFNPWNFGQGVVFDTRSVLLVISGFFFGTIPAIFAILITGIFRFVTGGEGKWTGLAVIVTSGAIGLVWRHYRPKRNHKPSVGELYLLGIVVHVAMLGWMFLLPWQLAIDVLSKISLPVMLIYPVATAILGNLMVMSEKRRQAQEALLASEELYRTYVNRAPSGIFTVDQQGRYVDVNPQVSRITGYDRSELLTMSIPDLILPESIKEVREFFARLKKKQIASRELRFSRKDGESRWCSFTATSISEDMFLCFVNDVTDRRIQEENRSIFLELLDNAEHVVVFKDVQLRYVMINRAYITLTGHTLADVAGKTDAETFAGISTPEQINKYMDNDRRALILPQGQCLTVEEDTLAPDGSTRTFLSKKFPVYAQDGRLLGVGTITSEITVLKRVEVALRESEEKFRTVATYIHDWEYWTAPDGNLVYVSPSCERITSYTREEFLQDPGLLTRIIHPDDRKNFILHLKSVENGRTNEDCYAGDFRILTRNGEERWIAHTCREVFDPEGKSIGQRVSNQDITMRKRAEKEKENMQEDLVQAQKMEAIGTLAGGIAHDFNNILGAILGYAEMAYEDSLQGSVDPSDLNQVVQAGRRAKDLVKQILAFSRRADSQEIPLRPAALVKESIKLLRSSIPTTIDIQQDVDSETNLILADPTKIHQIVMNLCTNSYHAMEEIGGTLSISLQNKVLTQQDLLGIPDVQPGQFVQLAVRDTGSGISPVIKERIFDPYFTTKETGKGTGMGLAIVHGIVKSSGGFITCHSEIGAGTVFEIYLPALLEQIVPETKELEKIPVGTERILFVDDEEMLAKMGQTMLERFGYSVTVKTSSIDTLTIFKNQPDAFDLVITDQTMPGMTGMDLARSILQIRPELPIILCTGYSGQVTEEKAKSYGIKGFAMKPLARKDIAVLIRKLLDEEKGYDNL